MERKTFRFRVNSFSKYGHINLVELSVHENESFSLKSTHYRYAPLNQLRCSIGEAVFIIGHETIRAGSREKVSSSAFRTSCAFAKYHAAFALNVYIL